MRIFEKIKQNKAIQRQKKYDLIKNALSCECKSQLLEFTVDEILNNKKLFWKRYYQLRVLRLENEAIEAVERNVKEQKEKQPITIAPLPPITVIHEYKEIPIVKQEEVKKEEPKITNKIKEALEKKIKGEI